MALVDVIVEDDRWQDAGLEPLAESAAVATLRALTLDPAAFEISLMGCDDARIAALNASFRDKPVATNVLSWPTAERAATADGDAPPLPQQTAVAPQELGDIAIAYDTCVQEARDQAKPLGDHVTHLIVHATLHLLGYDHVRAGDAARMEALEITILAGLGLGDPYAAGDAQQGG